MMLNIKVYRCGGMDSYLLLEVGTFEEVCDVIKADIKELNNPEYYSWCIDIDNNVSHCNSFEYTVQKGWIDTLYINFALVKRLNELMA